MFVLIIGRRENYQQPVEQAFIELGVDWTLRFAADATAALSLVQQSAPDVVVCELHPVGMDGNALLDRIRVHAPDAARIMLLEEGESTQAMQALVHAHRLLNKPLRAEELIEAVDGISDLRDLLDSPELKAAIGKIDRLPPPPELYLALSRAVADPDTSLAYLANLVAQDAGTAARVLRICNSAFFSSGRAITSVRSAVVRLGQQELRRIVLASEVFRDVPGGVDREAMRQRSLLASQLAGRIIDNANAEMATTAALLAEVGMLLPGVWIPGDEDEAAASGPHYADAGAYLLGIWGLPMPIVEAVAHHCFPLRARSRGFGIGGAVHVACALAGGRAVDEAFLESVGMSQRLPSWQRLAEELGAKQAAKAAHEQSGSRGQTDEERRQAARELLASHATAVVSSEQTEYLLLASSAKPGATIEAVEAAYLLHKFDAVALDLCQQRLQPAPLTRPGWSDLFGGEDSLLRLGRSLLQGSHQRIEMQVGVAPDAVVQATLENAHQRKLQIWPIDLPLDQILLRVLGGLSWTQRWRLWRRARRRQDESANDEVAVDLLAHGDPLVLAFAPVMAVDGGLKRHLFAEREAYMFAKLRTEARQAQARRVLVVVAAGHLPGLKRLARATQKSPATAAADSTASR